MYTVTIMPQPAQALKHSPAKTSNSADRRSRCGRSANRAAWALLLTGLAIAGGGALFDVGGFGFGCWGIELLTQAALAASVVALTRPGSRLARLAEGAACWAIALAVLAVFPPGWVLAGLNSHETPFYQQTPRRVAAITIDDAIDPASTPALLATLANHDVQATFFVLSDSIDGNEALLSQAIAAGHEIANHQTRDVRGWRMSEAEFASDIRTAGERLRRHTAVRWLRPGGGVYNRRMVATAESEGYPIALGSVFPFDSHVPSSAFVANYLEARVHPGAIIVLHDGAERGLRTAAALDRVLPRLKHQGYRFVTLSGLLGKD